MIEGVCLVSFTTAGVEIHQLATHPKNLSEKSTEPIVRRVGKAMLKSLAEIALANGKKSMKLDAMPHVIVYYRHLGFEICSNQPSCQTTLTTMKISESGLRQLSNCNAPALIPSSESLVFKKI